MRMRDKEIHEDNDLHYDEPIREAFFQFDGGEPVKFANVVGNVLTICLGEPSGTVENATIEFTDGEGRTFRMYLA